MGQTSLAGFLTRQLEAVGLSQLECCPGPARPAPGTRQFYSGGHTVARHSRWKGVDAIQVVSCTVCLYVQRNSIDNFMFLRHSGFKIQVNC